MTSNRSNVIFITALDCQPSHVIQEIKLRSRWYLFQMNTEPSHFVQASTRRPLRPSSSSARSVFFLHAISMYSRHHYMAQKSWSVPVDVVCQKGHVDTARRLVFALLSSPAAPSTTVRCSSWKAMASRSLIWDELLLTYFIINICFIKTIY